MNDKSPAIAKAVTNSGEPTKANVFGFPSARLEKFLLNECTIVFLSSFSAPSLSHIPIQGPQAFAKTVAPILSKVSINPSRSIVYLTNSEPGVIVKCDLVFKFFSDTCFAKDAAREISSYEELVQEPINPYWIFNGQLFLIASSFILEIGVAKSGVKGPFK